MCYAHPDVRSYAVAAISSIDDDYLLGIMLQLTQALKYEQYHMSALGMFLLKRALQNRLIGHRFFWYLKAEIHQIEIRERYGLLIEAYLNACGDFRRDIFRENTVLNDLTTVGNIIKSTPASERLQKLRHELSLIQFPKHPDGFLIPTDFGVRVKGLVIDKCKYMDSKKLPMWLVFENADPDGPNVYVIFKVGDDLRQDILTLQMITLMYKQVQNSPLALDLRMRPYAVVATGDEIGMLEVVMNSDTVAHIQAECGGFRGALREDPMLLWLEKEHVPDIPMPQIKETFMFSCAGYSVVTYLLGIGDRHNDNIMVHPSPSHPPPPHPLHTPLPLPSPCQVTRAGNLFHIDFGHFLGNFKEKFGVKRERAPFVFTPDFA